MGSRSELVIRNMKNNNWKLIEVDDFTLRYKTNRDNGYDMAGYEFEIYEVEARELNGNKLYMRKGATQSGDFSENILEDAQPYLTGFIKWDGCSHFYFGDEGYLHLCGFVRIQKLIVILQHLIKLAKETGVEG